MIIGNEILSGKIREGNLYVLACELRRLGIALVRAIVCPDDVEVIAADLTALREAHDLDALVPGLSVEVANLAKLRRPVEIFCCCCFLIISLWLYQGKCGNTFSRPSQYR